jgi:hypothetical protein
LARRRSLAFILRPGCRRAAYRSPRRIYLIGQLTHLVGCYTANKQHERIAKIHTPSFLGSL